MRTRRAPRTFRMRRRSCVMVSGMVRTSLRPRAAATNASAMPVLPEVGSMRTVSFVMRPDFRASSIIAKPMRSLTLESGLKNSSLRSTSACALWRAAVRLRRTRGVLPMVSVMSL